MFKQKLPSWTLMCTNCRKTPRAPMYLLLCVLALLPTVRASLVINSQDARDSYLTVSWRDATDSYDGFRGANDVTAPRRRDPEEDMTTPEIARYCGYSAEIHHVVTEDGFILEMHRVLPPGHSSDDPPRTPVFLQHGLLGSSSDWVMNPCSQCLPFMLVDSGYDVWLGNIRGNVYSRNHTKYSPKQHEFWQFSWDEMAVYDLPAMLDYVMNRTNVESIRYLGYSMGTTMMFALLAERPEFNTKIEAFYAFAPVTELRHADTLLRLLSPLVKDVEFLFDLLGVDELLPTSKLMKFLGDTVCRIAPRIACENIIFVFAGYDPYQVNTTRLPIYIAHNPAGASVQTVVHYAQIINSGKFQHYDWGEEINMQKYGQKWPPTYDLSKVLTPVYLFWGQTDVLADPLDVRTLSTRIPHLALNYRVPTRYFNHLDFAWAIDAPTLVYKPLIKALNTSLPN